MLPTEFEGSRWIGKPRNMTDEQCSGIFAKNGKAIDKPKLLFEVLEELPPKVPETEAEFLEFLASFFEAIINKIRIANFYGIPAFHAIDANNFPRWLTAWKPNLDDLNALNNGEPIYISSLSEYLIPMGVFTLNESGEINE